MCPCMSDIEDNVNKKFIHGLDIHDLSQALLEVGCSPGTELKLAVWIYRKRIFRTGAMSNMNRSCRRLLDEHFSLEPVWPVSVSESTDGSKKYLFRFHGNRYAEAALIPSGKRLTLCISSQAGCQMGCSFCQTASHGFHGQLSHQEIVSQLAGLPECGRVTHIVVMGMGEPFNNLDAVLKALDVFAAPWGFAIGKRNITVSTVGFPEQLEQFVLYSPYNLAVSLHSPFSIQRQELMPVEKISPIESVVTLLRQYPILKPRRLSFEYLLLSGVNNTQQHAVAVAGMLKGLRCHVNLIPFNWFPGSSYKPPSGAEVQLFRDQLAGCGVTTTIRNSRGADIEAACGLLAARGFQDVE